MNLRNQKIAQRHDALAGEGSSFRAKLIRWFEQNGKSYPWRDTQDPYAILVSELMLQQTQVATVLERGYYQRWMKRFPETKTLAAADESEVLKLWEGLGYYSRARRLHQCAQNIEQQFAGSFPADLASIRLLPGVGPYTAGAVASFAFDLPAAIVDGNVARVLARLFDYREAVDSTAGGKMIWSLAQQLMPKRKNARSREYNSALMELGQTLCNRSEPLCGDCPVSAYCATRDPKSLPIKKPRQKTVLMEEDVLFAKNKGRILLEKESGSRRTGLWKLPALHAEESSHSPHQKEQIVLTMKYSITKYRVTLYVHQVKDTANIKLDQHRKWFAIAELDQLTLGAPYRRALEKLL
ncbi:MAG: A/G-specific adenine glycosylase [Verrucomicrobiales bacterium]|nr:A/G-specific adenine glycosylase [Verrucomicrobiales bacterium]